LETSRPHRRIRDPERAEKVSSCPPCWFLFVPSHHLSRTGSVGFENGNVEHCSLTNTFSLVRFSCERVLGMFSAAPERGLEYADRVCRCFQDFSKVITTLRTYYVCALGRRIPLACLLTSDHQWWDFLSGTISHFESILTLKTSGIFRGYEVGQFRGIIAGFSQSRIF
jgi:hypothetical protein